MSNVKLDRSLLKILQNKSPGTLAIFERSVELLISACEILGLDPLYLVTEGKLVAVVPGDHADAVVEAMRRHPAGTHGHDSPPASSHRSRARFSATSTPAYQRSHAER